MPNYTVILSYAVYAYEVEAANAREALQTAHQDMGLGGEATLEEENCEVFAEDDEEKDHNLPEEEQ